MDSSLFSPLLAGIALVPAAAFGLAWWFQRSRAHDAERRLADSEVVDDGGTSDRRSAELEALGRLAGNVAHDFNNVLTVVSANTEILLMELAMPEADLDAERLESSLQQVRTAAQRGTVLTRRLQAFGRRNAPLPRGSIDVGEAVLGLEGRLAALLTGGHELRIQSEGPVAHVRADADQLEGLLSALVENAADAMPEGGRVTIDLRAPADSGGVELAVTDEGEGMSAEVQARLFEPFFTTRSSGERAGFGLATVHGIVQRLGGRVEVESRPGRGSTFRVRLPRAEAATAATEG